MPEEETKIDVLNQCKHCGNKAGMMIYLGPEERIGIFLYNSSRGGKVCNLCIAKGIGIRKRKLKKLDKKKMKKLKTERFKIST